MLTYCYFLTLRSYLLSQIILHILDAQKKLNAHSQWLHTCLTATHEQAKRIMHIPPLDVVVKTGKFVIPEKGHLGYCPEPGLVYLTVDPENPAFRKNAAQSFERMFAHELHHAARWAGPGYGITLGEAMVSEGLAGHFVLELFGGEPEPWENINSDIVQSYNPQLKANWHSTDYDHNRWFFGTGDLPQWLGYTAGFNLVSRYFSTAPHLRSSVLSNVNADELQTFL
ncbi:peptidase [Citrobacter gillenii]|uniref:Peptidase n=2 Tax=Citrobacter gillenii TaxID=67828 RepID=A0ABD6M308_9ENTR|nr:peptidase [Citrobacter gillenii]